MQYLTIAIVFFFFWTIHAYADELDLEKYKQAYIEQVKPILEKQIATTLERQEDPNATLNFLVKGMANCQVEILVHYPAKYQAATVNPVIDGKGLKQATKEVNRLMQQDIEAGKTTQEEVIKMVQNSRNHFLKCSKKLEKEL